MPPYDDLNLPGRTMLTSEGTVNRSTHLLKINGKHRLLTPVEAERLQDFPDGWTARKKLADGTVVEVSDKMRMFFMGSRLLKSSGKSGRSFQKLKTAQIVKPQNRGGRNSSGNGLMQTNAV